MSSIYTGDPGRRLHIFITLIAFPFCASIFVGLRLWARLKNVRFLGPEDIASVAALVASISLAVLLCYETAIKTESEKFLTLSELSLILKAIYGNVIAHNSSLFFTKLSFILQYLRIFPSRRMRILTWTALAVITIYGSWSVFGQIFICWPISVNWDPSRNILSGDIEECMNHLLTYRVNAGLNIATDVMVITLPLPKLRSVMLPLNQKIALMGVFALGGSVCVISIIRLIALFHAQGGPIFDYAGQPMVVWTTVEVNLAIMCSCLPTLRPSAISIWSRIMPNSTKREKMLLYFSSTGDKLKQSRSWNNWSRNRSEKQSRGESEMDKSVRPYGMVEQSASGSSGDGEISKISFEADRPSNENKPSITVSVLEDERSLP